MRLSNHNLTAFITGGRRGIGFSIAERLYRDGLNIVLFDMDHEDTLSAASSLDPSGKRTLACTGNVSSHSDLQSAVQQAVSRFGAIQVLVNNAGISPKHNGIKAPVDTMCEQEWRQVIDVNLTGTFLATQACLPFMKSVGWGRIINVSSQAARTASTIAGAHYAASKAGILAFSRSLAAEVGPLGITVNSVAPGRILTPMAAEAGETANAAYLNRIPVNRLGKPEDVAGTVSFLISDDASFITGAVIDVNGGAFMAG